MGLNGPNPDPNGNYEKTPFDRWAEQSSWFIPTFVTVMILFDVAICYICCRY